MRIFESAKWKSDATASLAIAILACFLSYGPNVAAAATGLSYDALNRLLQVTYADGSSISYTYDAAGNRLTQTATASVGDSVLPTVQITAPANGSLSYNLNIVVSGQASDNTAVSNVKYDWNSTGWSNAVTSNNWTNWTASVTAIVGTNTVAAYATDTSGNKSATNTIAFVYVSTNAPGYNRIAAQLLTAATVRLSYLGVPGWNYAVDRTFNLSPPNWVPLATNPADGLGLLSFTNTAVAATNNFWRIRSVP